MALQISETLDHKRIEKLIDLTLQFRNKKESAKSTDEKTGMQDVPERDQKADEALDNFLKDQKVDVNTGAGLTDFMDSFMYNIQRKV